MLPQQFTATHLHPWWREEALREEIVLHKDYGKGRSQAEHTAIVNTYLPVFSQSEAIILSSTDCTIFLSAALLLQDLTFPLLPIKVSSCGNTLDR